MKSRDVDWLMRAATETPFVSLAGRFVGTERYELEEVIGEGGFGIVYSAIDHRHGGRVALKLLRRGSEGMIRFKREFRALADVSHPNLVRLYELFAVDPHWFFTMQLVEGIPFVQYLRKNPGRVRPALTQLALGLRALHQAGIIHCDIKPSNVLVGADGHITILDFGLSISNELAHSAELAGTPPYMSPDQLEEKPLTESSDWYAVGVMLYEVLAGRLPFEGPPPVIFEAKRKREPPPPSAHTREVDRELEGLCMALVRRDPLARLHGDEVIGRLQCQSPPNARRTRGALHGREREMDALRAAFAQTRTGRRTVTLVSGASGIGKSTLLRSFVEEVQREHPDALLLAGRCYEHETVPYKALDPIVDELTRNLRRRPDSEVEALLPQDVATLAQLFPVLRQLPSVAARRSQKRGMDPVERRGRGMAALRALLAAVARTRPVVVCVDDLHWGDVDSAALLAELARPPDPPAICLVGSFRAEEVATSPLLMRLAELRGERLADVPIVEIALAPLSSEDARRMAAELLAEQGRDPRRAQTIATESGGTPFLVRELVLAGDGGCAGVDSLVERRVARLPPAAAQILETLAVIGRPVDGELLGRAVDVGAAQRDSLLRLRSEHLVRGRDPDLVEVYHDRIRQGVVRAIDGERKREIHARVARALETTDTADPEELLQHHRQAGDEERAASAAVKAAARAAASLAFDRAARLYRTALELRAGDSEKAGRLHKLLGDSLANAGRGAEAATEYQKAAADSPSPEALDLKRRAAEEFLRSGHLDQGLQLLGSILAAVRLKNRLLSRSALPALIWNRAVSRVRGIQFREREAASLPMETLARIDILFAASVGVHNVDPISAAEFQARALRLALAAGEPRRVARALVAEGCFVGMAGVRRRERACRLIDRAAALADRVDDPQIRGQVMLARGLVGYMRGDFREARTQLEAAERFVRSECTRMTWELDMAQLYLVDSLYWLGELVEVARQAPARLRDAEERGDLYASVALCAVASPGIWLARDDPAAARREVERSISRWSVSGFHAKHLNALLAAANADLYEGDGRAALDRIDARRNAIERSRLHRIQVLRIKLFDAEGRAALAAARAGVEARSMLARARRNVARLVGERTEWATSLAALLDAGAAALDGDGAEAARRYGAVADLLDTAGLQLHAAVARRARGILDGNRELVERGECWLAERWVRRPDRLASMLAPAV